MSIIIRLQNLPLSARTGDIRKFFGGLRIPDGGVHILGGENGDAFIAFMSDEDARIAMRKDGGRIKDSRIKLFLSSRMEMQHEVEKITKGSIVPVLPEEIIPGRDSVKSKSLERRKRSHSPHQYDRPLNDYQRSKSPIIYNPRKLSPVRHRSRSPRRRSRSRSPRSAPKSRSYGSRRKSISPKPHVFHSLPADDLSHFPKKNSGSQFLSQSERQAELEWRITKEIEKNALYRRISSEEENRFQESHQQHSFQKQDDLMSFPHSEMSSSNMYHFKEAEFKHNYRLKKEKLASDLFLRNVKEKNEMDSFYIILDGMIHSWGFREVQIILKGHYAPQNNIRMEVDDAGYKTGRAVVKLTNKDDFDGILKKSFFQFKGQKIVVEACPHYIAQKYFQFNSDLRNDNYMHPTHDLCYILKGLPFTCKYDDVIAFFQGFEISDLIIFYGEDGQATGTGFVSFKNWKDFEGAFVQNGKKIGHRYIELLPCTAQEMAEAKKTQEFGGFIPYSQILFEKRLPNSRRPICALVTGLPLTTSRKKLLNFFAESDLKPDAIHLTMSTKKLSDGRAFVEFSNYLDFELALKLHGKKIDARQTQGVCVKQILFDEMMKILDSQKAKHYFETSNPNATVSEPEKVPYLWEPPDAKHEKEVYSKDNRVLPSDKFQAPSFFNYNKNIGSNFLPNDMSKRNIDPWYNQASTNPDSLQSVYPNNPGLDAYGMKTKMIGNFTQHPVPYDNKEVMMHVYHSTKKYEDNIKSSRLSPENEAALLDFLNRDKRSLISRKSRRSRSLERRNENSYGGRNFDTAKRYKDERYSKFRAKESSKIKNVKELVIDKGIGKNECIVQLSNVDISVGTRDLINFLRGFDFLENTLIRRYTADNVPTTDVRVTFSDKEEAERAIRILNKHFLNGKPVSMFII